MTAQNGATDRPWRVPLGADVPEGQPETPAATPAPTPAPTPTPTAAPQPAPEPTPAPTDAFDPDALTRDAPEPLPDDAPLAGGDKAHAAGVIRASGARLTEVIDQRARGLDPNAEAAQRRAETAGRRDSDLRQRARWRLGLLCFAFMLAYGAVAGKMAFMAASEPREPRGWASSAGPVEAVRGEIHDRNGRLLAANLPVHSLYARPDEMIDPVAAAQGLARIFPDENEKALLRQFTDGRKFMWVRRTITPSQRLEVHNLGEPGLRFGPRDARIYPKGRLAAHILGGAAYGEEGELAAEIVGVAGLEHWFDARLRDPALAAAPLRLSIDQRAQAAFAEVLAGAVEQYHAKGAAGVLLDATNGEIIAMVSLPDFDPNDRNAFFRQGRAEDSPLFNRAAQGLYELGSTYKIFTAAMVMDAGIATPDTMMDTRGPLVSGRFRIRDGHRMDPEMSLRDIMIQSSNVGTARFAMIAGARRQRDFLETLGLLVPAPVELPEAAGATPLLPDKWRDISTMTISFGHGISGSPLHLAAAYAAMVNGGLKVNPTLLVDAQPPGEDARVISALTSSRIRDMMRAVVTSGTGRNAEAAGYFLGGKTGSAEKPRRDGKGYDRTKIVATFAGAFPIHDPKYVIVVTLDEAEDRTGTQTRRTAGWTAAPTTRAVITRIAPLLGMRPAPEAVAQAPGPGAQRVAQGAGAL
ncbi:MAG: cell division protein FtsI (penicillin-binding protein 3) [Paracoccaceae bacterium]|jgi:cell division protein FtsI (penicillin-binding protein 3)